jgi:hypothetical protein
MKRFVVLICFAIALPVAANDGALKGVRSVYIDTLNLFDQRDLVIALKQLPNVRVVSRRSDADVALEFVRSRDETRSVGPMERQAIAGTARVAGVARRLDGTTLVIQEGSPHDAFAKRFGARFVEVWRESN